MNKALTTLLSYSLILSACSSSPILEARDLEELMLVVDKIQVEAKLDGNYDKDLRHLMPACKDIIVDCLRRLKTKNNKNIDLCVEHSINGKKVKDVIMTYKNKFGKFPQVSSIDELNEWFDKNWNVEEVLNTLPQNKDYSFKAPLAACLRRAGINSESEMEKNPEVVNECIRTDLAGKYFIDLYADHKPDYSE